MSRNLTVAVLLTARDQLSAVLDGAGKKLDGFGQRAEKIGRSMESAGTRIGAIGVAGQAGLSRLGLDLGSLVSKSIESERALYGIANTAGVAGAAAREMVTEWTVAVNQIAIATNQSQDRVIAAFNDMIAKGLDPKTAIAMLQPIGQAATAAGADITDMASAAQAGFSKLKIDAADAGRALDIMAQAGKSGAFELRDMAGYFDKLTASAANLGMSGQASLASLAAAAQIARRGTGDAAQAATNLDNFLSKLNASVTYKAFDEMGVDLGKLKEEAKASGDYLGYMAQAIQQITGGDTAKIADLFSDIQAGAFIQGMVRDLEDYKSIRDEALAANGVAAQDFATAMQSAGAQIDQFKVSATAAASSGSAIKEILSGLTGVANWANENPELAKWIIFGTAAAAVGGAAVAGIGAIVTAVGSLSVALGGLAAFLAANPIVAGLLGVAAVGAAAFAFGTWIADQIDIAVQAVTGDKFASLGTALFDLVEWFKAVPGRIKAAIKGWYAEFKAVGQNLVQGIIDGLKAKAQEVTNRVKAIGSDALDAIKNTLGIRSPSREMMLVGENTVLGMLIGMENEAPGLIETAEGIAEDAADALEKPFRDNKGRFLPADAAERAAAEWDRASQDIERSLTDALMRGFEGGKDWASNFKDTLKNMFSTLVLRPIVQPIAQAGASLITGAFGMGASGSANASGSLLGSIGNSMAGSALGNWAGAAFSGVGTSVSAGLFSSLGGAGAAQASMLAAQTAGFGAFGTGSTLSALGSAGGAATAGAATAGSALSAVGAALPWIGAALPIAAAFGAFKPKPSNKAAWGTVDIDTGELSKVGNMTGKKQASGQTISARDMLLEAVKGYTGSLKSLGGEFATQSIKVDFGERDGVQFIKDGKYKSYGNDPAKALATLFRELAEETTGLEDDFRKALLEFDGSSEEYIGLLGKVRQAIDVVIPTLDDLGMGLTGTGWATQSAAIALLDLMGGIEGFNNATAFFVQNFYTEAERMERAQAALSAQFDALNLAVPDSMSAFRALVEAQDLMTASGRESYAALMQLAPSFASITQAAETAAAAAAKRVADERYGLETQLLQAQGDTAELRRRELLLLDASNVALQEQIWAIEDQAAANAAAADQASRAAEQAASAAQQLTEAWRSVTDAIFAEVRRIRGMMGADTAVNAEAQFAIATAQARAGDQEAAKLLPSLSRALLDLAAVNASTAEDLARIQGRTAGSLLTTGNMLAGRYGLPSFDVGTNYVPGDMTANIHEGERIVPAADNAELMARLREPQANTQAMVAEIRALREEVALLRAEARATAGSTAKTARLLDRAMPDGDAIATRAAV